MSQKQSSSEPPQPRFPRVSGDEPITAIFAKKDWGFPRMSGDEPFL